MTKELCGEPTAKGPCNMKKGHPARFHRYRTYPKMEWKLMNETGAVIDKGVGVNPLTYAISRNRVTGVKMIAEISC